MSFNTIEANRRAGRFADREQLWLFGYGSLIYKAGFDYLERRPASITGWVRRFWQGSHDHRGTPDAPGRVATLVRAPGETCLGMAYRVTPAIFEHLDHREKNGYLRFATEMTFADGTTDEGVTLSCWADGDGDGDGNGDGDPLSRALCTKESYQNIRSLPRLAGQSVLFTHRILHWGSRGNPHSHLTTPRIAMSFVCSDPAFERPYLAASLAESIPPFRTRLLLVCAVALALVCGPLVLAGHLQPPVGAAASRRPAVSAGSATARSAVRDFRRLSG